MEIQEKTFFFLRKHKKVPFPEIWEKLFLRKYKRFFSFEASRFLRKIYNKFFQGKILRAKGWKMYQIVLKYNTWGPYLWNKVLQSEKKIILSEYLFKKKTKERFSVFQNEIHFFWFNVPVSSSNIPHKIFYIKDFINEKEM